MSQPPNPPSGGTPPPPSGWNPDPNPSWASDPTQQFPAGQQYPPTQPLPAGEQYPGQYGQNPGQYGQNPGQYGQIPAGGQYPGQYGPPGGGFGAPPPAPPAGGSGGGRSQAPLIIGIVAGVVVIGLLAWFLFLRPAGTASPVPSSAAPTAPVTSAPPSVLITPSAGPSDAPSNGPSDSGSPAPSGSTSASCAAELGKNQCDWAVYLRKFVVVSSCVPDSSDEHREAFTCAANARGKLEGNATVSLRWADDNADLTELMDGFFKRAGVSKSKIGSNWKKPPALTNWWYTDKPKEIIGKLGSADKTSGSGVSWTFKKQLFYVEASSDSDNAQTMIDWWANS